MRIREIITCRVKGKKKKEREKKKARSRARRVPYTVHRVKIWRHLDRIKLRKRWNSTYRIKK